MTVITRSEQPSAAQAWVRGRCELASLAALALLIGLFAGCSGQQRPILTEAQLQQRAEADLERTQQTFRTVVGRTLQRAASKPSTESPDQPPVLDFLAISGGGDFGAFGAGFLVGWGNTPDPAMRRPDFDAVTGVSTGALLAPFAYVGTDEACRAVEQFYRNPKQDWVQDRGLLFFLPSNPSFMTIPGLERDIRFAIGPDLIALMAEQSRRGKVLAISATDLDLGRQRFWDVGAEAEAGSASGQPGRVQDILLASAAIPALFPPIPIDDSVYADGGMTANVLLRLDPHSPDALLPRWKREHPNRSFPKLRYWVLINNQVNQPPKTVQVRWPNVVGPSLGTAIRSATMAEVRWLAAQANYVNAIWGTDIEVRVVAIPDQWRPPVEGDFKRETMVSLADLGRKMGADPSSWQVWTLPRGTAPSPSREVLNPSAPTRANQP